MSEKTLKEQQYDEIWLKNRVEVEGVEVDPAIFQNAGVGETIREQVNALFARDHYAHQGIAYPACFILPHGYRVGISGIPGSPFSLQRTGDDFQLLERGKVIIPKVQFEKRPAYYSKKTSDGTPMKTVAQQYPFRHLFVAYSNECSLKEHGKDCLFCNINATKDIYAACENISWKTPKQIGETIAEGYKEGNTKVTISGGFIPERREVDYYIDVAEAIQEHTGLEDFNGTACIGAPLEMDVYDKYKEAGYRTIATNLEVWNDQLFKVICPGKEEYCGGRDNWLKALEHAVDVFGRYNVRSTLVSGLEPKDSLLEGIEILLEKGIIAQPSQWNVNVGSPLEGHRTPTPEWHYEIHKKTAALYKKYGVTWEQLDQATAGSDGIAQDIFRAEAGIVEVPIVKLK